MLEYKKVNVSLEPKTTIEATANRWAAMGWHVASVIPSSGPGYADTVLVGREKPAPPISTARREYLVRFLRGCASAADLDQIGAEMADDLRPLLVNGDLMREAADALEEMTRRDNG